MSSYIDVVHPDRHAPYLDIPNDVVEYLHYLDFVKMRSPRTINAYYLDLRGFFRFMMAMQWSRVPRDTPLEEINLKDISTEDIKKITKRDIFSYLDYVRSTDANGGKARARSRRAGGSRAVTSSKLSIGMSLLLDTGICMKGCPWL